MCAAAPAGRVSRTNWVVAIVLTGYHRQTTAAIQGRSPRRSSEPRIVRAPCSTKVRSPSALETETPVGDRDPEQRSLHFAEVVRGGLRRLRPQRDADRLRPPRQSRERPAGTSGRNGPSSPCLCTASARASCICRRECASAGWILPSSCATAGPPNQPSAANTACWTRGLRSRASRAMLRHSVCTSTPSPYAAATRSRSAPRGRGGRPRAPAWPRPVAMRERGERMRRADRLVELLAAARSQGEYLGLCADVSRPTGGRSSRLAATSPRSLG